MKKIWSLWLTVLTLSAINAAPLAQEGPRQNSGGDPNFVQGTQQLPHELPPPLPQAIGKPVEVVRFVHPTLSRGVSSLEELGLSRQGAFGGVRDNEDHFGVGTTHGLGGFGGAEVALGGGGRGGFGSGEAFGFGNGFQNGFPGGVHRFGFGRPVFHNGFGDHGVGHVGPFAVPGFGQGGLNGFHSGDHFSAAGPFGGRQFGFHSAAAPQPTRVIVQTVPVVVDIVNRTHGAVIPHSQVAQEAVGAPVASTRNGGTFFGNGFGFQNQNVGSFNVPASVGPQTGDGFTLQSGERSLVEPGHGAGNEALQDSAFSPMAALIGTPVSVAASVSGVSGITHPNVLPDSLAQADASTNGQPEKVQGEVSVFVASSDSATVPLASLDQASSTVAFGQSVSEGVQEPVIDESLNSAPPNTPEGGSAKSLDGAEGSDALPIPAALSSFAFLGTPPLFRNDVKRRPNIGTGKSLQEPSLASPPPPVTDQTQDLASPPFGTELPLSPNAGQASGVPSAVPLGEQAISPLAEMQIVRADVVGTLKRTGTAVVEGTPVLNIPEVPTRTPTIVQAEVRSLSLDSAAPVTTAEQMSVTDLLAQTVKKAMAKMETDMSAVQPAHESSAAEGSPTNSLAGNLEPSSFVAVNRVGVADPQETTLTAGNLQVTGNLGGEGPQSFGVTPVDLSVLHGEPAVDITPSLSSANIPSTSERAVIVVESPDQQGSAVPDQLPSTQEGITEGSADPAVQTLLSNGDTAAIGVLGSAAIDLTPETAVQNQGATTTDFTQNVDINLATQHRPGLSVAHGQHALVELVKSAEGSHSVNQDTSAASAFTPAVASTASPLTDETLAPGGFAGPTTNILHTGSETASNGLPSTPLAAVSVSANNGFSVTHGEPAVETLSATTPLSIATEQTHSSGQVATSRLGVAPATSSSPFSAGETVATPGDQTAPLVIGSPSQPTFAGVKIGQSVAVPITPTPVPLTTTLSPVTTSVPGSNTAQANAAAFGLEVTKFSTCGTITTTEGAISSAPATEATVNAVTTSSLLTESGASHFPDQSTSRPILPSPLVQDTGSTLLLGRPAIGQPVLSQTLASSGPSVSSVTGLDPSVPSTSPNSSPTSAASAAVSSGVSPNAGTGSTTTATGGVTTTSKGSTGLVQEPVETSASNLSPEIPIAGGGISSNQAGAQSNILQQKTETHAATSVTGPQTITSTAQQSGQVGPGLIVALPISSFFSPLGFASHTGQGSTFLDNFSITNDPSEFLKLARNFHSSQGGAEASFVKGLPNAQTPQNAQNSAQVPSSSPPVTPPPVATQAPLTHPTTPFPPVNTAKPRVVSVVSPSGSLLFLPEDQATLSSSLGFGVPLQATVNGFPHVTHTGTGFKSIQDPPLSKPGNTLKRESPSVTA